MPTGSSVLARCHANSLKTRVRFPARKNGSSWSSGTDFSFSRPFCSFLQPPSLPEPKTGLRTRVASWKALESRLHLRPSPQRPHHQKQGWDDLSDALVPLAFGKLSKDLEHDAERVFAWEGVLGALWPPGPRVSGFQAASGVRGVAGPRVGEARNRLGGHQNWLLNVRFVGRGGRVLLQGSGMCEPGTPRGCGGSRPGGPGFPPPADGSFSPAGARLAGPRVPGGCHVPHGRRGRPGGY